MKELRSHLATDRHEIQSIQTERILTRTETIKTRSMIFSKVAALETVNNL